MMLSRRRRLVLLALLALLVPAAAACGGGGDGGGETTEPTTATEATTPTETSATTGGDGATGDAEAGAAVWESAGCGGCHVLAAAGSEGSVGPDLDELQPDFEATVEQVTNGGGGMPAFEDQLSETQILDVSAYVVRSTSG